MSAYVVVQLTSPHRTARTRGGRDEHPALVHRKVRQLLTEHGAEVLGTQEPTSAGDGMATAMIAVRDMACAHKLAAALREADGIESAYAKPAEELP